MCVKFIENMKKRKNFRQENKPVKELFLSNEKARRSRTKFKKKYYFSA